MDTIRSLGFRTDLMLLSMQGSTIERRDGYLVVSTPDNPTFHWGNFLLLDEAIEPGTADRWLGAFAQELPHADHVALGIDATDAVGAAADPADPAEFAVDRSTVMTARSLRPPRHPNGDARLRMLGDDDWEAALELREANNADIEPAEYRPFARRQLAAMRELQARGLGGWFGAFLDGRMVAGLGVFGDGSGTVRYQTVDTHPGYRRRGLAGTLVHFAGRHALERMGAQRLVIVADPDYSAIRLYRALGFEDRETQTQLERPATPPPAGE